MSRHHRNIEEEFQAIAPKGQRGIPLAQPIAVGVTGPSLSMSQPSQEIAQLEAQFRQQSNLIQSNIQAPQSSSAHGGQSFWVRRRLEAAASVVDSDSCHRSFQGC